MNTLIPLEYYYPVYINLCLFLVLFTLLHSAILKMEDSRNVVFLSAFGYVLFVFLVFYMGLRPINIIFGDTVNYNRTFLQYQLGEEITHTKDYGWHLFMKFLSGFLSIHHFFTLCIFLYIFPLYKISKTFFKQYWFYAFLMFVVSFSFWTYGVNGIRNGVACSLFLWGVS